MVVTTRIPSNEESATCRVPALSEFEIPLKNLGDHHVHRGQQGPGSGDEAEGAAPLEETELENTASHLLIYQGGDVRPSQSYDGSIVGGMNHPPPVCRAGSHGDVQLRTKVAHRARNPPTHSRQLPVNPQDGLGARSLVSECPLCGAPLTVRPT